jgi:hypothetical protein
MSVPQRQIPKDYLRLLRPLRALRAMLMTPSKSGHLLLGEAATPFFPFGETLSAVLTTFFCHLVHVNSWFVGGWNPFDSFHTRF